MVRTFLKVYMELGSYFLFLQEQIKDIIIILLLMSSPQTPRVCVFYYCRTYYKAVRVGGGGEWRTCAMRDDEPRPVWMSLPITHTSVGT